MSTMGDKLSFIFHKAKLILDRDGFTGLICKSIHSFKHLRSYLGMIAAGGRYRAWLRANRLTYDDRKRMQRQLEGFSYRPRISVLMPVHNTDPLWLEKALGSVTQQIYPDWQLCVVDDCSSHQKVRDIIDQYCMRDSRVAACYLDTHQGIAGASNAALNMAAGEFVALLDHDDELSEDALFAMVEQLNANPEADIVYSDEDKITTGGKRCHPSFKPDFSPDLLLSMNYICHLMMIRRTLVVQVGGFRTECEGSQDYDLLLRVIDQTRPDKICHIPKVLYHWRMAPGSAAAMVDAKSYASHAAQQALSNFLERNHINGTVEAGKMPCTYRVKRSIVDSEGTVAVIIPFRDTPAALEKCIDSVFDKTTHQNFRLVLVNNQSSQDKTLAYLERLKENPRIEILDYPIPFNYSTIINFAVSQISSEYLVLLNSDVEVLSGDWIGSMLEHCQRETVGAVGALLYYPNDTIQHAGITLGVGGIAGHTHRCFPRGSGGYFGRVGVVHNVSAVTAACMMTKRSLFNDVGGFDENLSHSFNDVDYCLKLRKNGQLIVYTPYAELYHHESLSRGRENHKLQDERLLREIDYFKTKWDDTWLYNDPYYNSNLTLKREDFSIALD